jgi:hypothetical protein
MGGDCCIIPGVADSPPENFYFALARVVRGEERKKLVANIHAFLSRHLKRSDLSTKEITVYEVY